MADRPQDAARAREGADAPRRPWRTSAALCRGCGWTRTISSTRRPAAARWPTCSTAATSCVMQHFMLPRAGSRAARAAPTWPTTPTPRSCTWRSATPPSSPSRARRWRRSSASASEWAGGSPGCLRTAPTSTAISTSPSPPTRSRNGKADYNFGGKPPGEEMPGVSVFYKDDAGEVFHTYSTYGRGVEVMMHTYRLLDLTPKGRDEDGPATMAWVRHHDRYEPRRPDARGTVAHAAADETRASPRARPTGCRWRPRPPSPSWPCSPPSSAAARSPCSAGRTPHRSAAWSRCTSS